MADGGRQNRRVTAGAPESYRTSVFRHPTSEKNERAPFGAPSPKAERRVFFEAQTKLCKALTMLPSSPHWGVTSTQYVETPRWTCWLKNRSLRPLFNKSSPMYERDRARSNRIMPYGCQTTCCVSNAGALGRGNIFLRGTRLDQPPVEWRSVCPDLANRHAWRSHYEPAPHEVTGPTAPLRCQISQLLNTTPSRATGSARPAVAMRRSVHRTRAPSATRRR
jgi:hypothetical protein